MQWDGKVYQRDLGFEEHFWSVYFSYSLMPSGHKIDLKKHIAIMIYQMKHRLEFDVGRIIVKRIVESGRRSNLSLFFPCLITHFARRAGLRVDLPADGVLTPSGHVGRRAYNEVAEGKP